MKESTELFNLKLSYQKNPREGKEGDFNNFAKKLRMDKIDKNVIMQYKSEAISHEKMKKKKTKSIMTVQKIIRGYILRKKFKNRRQLRILMHFKSRIKREMIGFKNKI